MDRITSDDDVLGGEPRIDGTRIGVRHVAARVVDSGQSPEHVADKLEVSLADVYAALSYYYAHIDKTRDTEVEKRSSIYRVRDRSETSSAEGVPAGPGLGEPTIDRTPISEMSDKEIEELHPVSDDGQ